MDKNSLISGLQLPTQPPLSPEEFSSRANAAKDLFSPFAALGRVMTGNSQAIPQDIGEAALGLIGPPVKGMAVGAAGGLGRSLGKDEIESIIKKITSALELPMDPAPVPNGSPSQQLNHFFNTHPNPTAENAIKWAKDYFHLENGKTTFMLDSKGNAIPRAEGVLAKNPGASIYDVAGVKAPDPTVESLKKAYPDSAHEIQSYYDKGASPGYIAELFGHNAANPIGVGNKQAQAAGKIIPSDWMGQTPYSGYTLNEEARQRLVPNAPLSHLESLGFNTKLPLYKGYTSERLPSATHYEDPTTRQTSSGNYERALFFGDAPEVAKHYANKGMGTYFARPQNPMELNWKDIAPSYGYQSSYMKDAIEAARSKNADFLTIKNIEDVGSDDLQNQYLLLTNPERLRRAQAKFDPSKINMNNLLATGAIGTAGAMAAPGIVRGLGAPQ